jgi:uncharacterized membrane-anchored protein
VTEELSIAFSSRGLPAEVPERQALAQEVHARPSQAIDTPSRVTEVSVVVDVERRPAEYRHLAALCAQWSIEPPAVDAVYFSGEYRDLRLRWERHTEFSSYTFIVPGRGAVPFSEPPIQELPRGWLESIPGRTIFAAHAEVVGSAELTPAVLSEFFGANIAVGSTIGGDAGRAYTDFKIHGDGFSRFVVVDERLTPRQAGRTLQRLFEIETYRMLSLLALPIARRLGPRIIALERTLADLTEDIARRSADDEAILEPLTKMAAEVESELAATQSRFSASRAYRDLVVTRIQELREQRLPGFQTIHDFMTRRFSPATATIASVERRLHELSERIGHVSMLLSTRVDIVRERQNQTLLASLNRRAEIQLHLQQAVEGLSVAAIVYYVAGLIGYCTKAAHELGVSIEPDIAVALSIPLVAALCIWALRRAHARVSNRPDGQSS